MSSLPSNGCRRTPRAAVAGVALVVGAGLLGGCGGSPKTAPAPGGGGKSAARPTTTSAPAEPQKAACGLVTRAEVETALGAKVAAGRESTEPSRSVCSFALASGPDQSVIIMSTTSSDAPSVFAGIRERLRASAQTVTAGEQAIVDGPQGRF